MSARQSIRSTCSQLLLIGQLLWAVDVDVLAARLLLVGY